MTAVRRPARPGGRPDERRPGPLWVAAVSTGAATALVAAIIAVAAVAVLWLPASAGSGSASSALRAGAILFVTSVHGGATVDGVPTAFVPLGLTLVVGVLLWRGATGLAGLAADAERDDPRDLGRAVLALAAGFALVTGLVATVSPLGTSSASVVGALPAAFVLALLVAGAAVCRHGALGDELRARVPAAVRTGVRTAVTVLAVHLGAGTLLLAGSIAVHHDRVTTLSSELGTGWSAVPVLLLGVLAVPNAAVAASGYLSGAGFAVGTGTSVGLTGHATGTVPAFPLLGALPTGDGASAVVWVGAALTAGAAGLVLAVLAARRPTWGDRWRTAGCALLALAVLGAVLAWQGGGGVGSGRLHVVGVSPWQYALALVLVPGGLGVGVLLVAWSFAALRMSEQEGRPGLRETIAALTAVETFADDDPDEDAPDTGDDGASAGRVSLRKTRRDGSGHEDLAG